MSRIRPSCHVAMLLFAIAASAGLPALVRAQEATPLLLELTAQHGGDTVFKLGQRLHLTVSVSAPAAVYCFYAPQPDRILRLFPNRFRPESRIEPGRPQAIPDPGVMGFEIVFDVAPALEQVLCFATRDRAEDKVAPAILAADLTPLRLPSLLALRQAFQQAGLSDLAEAGLGLAILR